jgi:ADP-L-glycero-D-manno-heptose 6-epimerase
MEKQEIIVVTGAAGFIGSCMVGFLNRMNFKRLILVDEFDSEEKDLNLKDKDYLSKVERDDFFNWIRKMNLKPDYFFHLGARTDTTEFDYSIHQKLNVEYSQQVWNYCTMLDIPLVYASSAATYGSGELGYRDDHEIIERLEPLNPYGISKNEFDKWVLHQVDHPPFWAGLKFFNVYGPNEYHKARMASVIFHSFNQIRKQGFVNLFKSHRPEFKDGEQLRDFIYVMDVVKVCYWLMDNRPDSGIYNLGTGKARSFFDLASSSFAGLDLKPDIRFVDMPEDIRERYQYFTEADMNKLIRAGYNEKFYTLEEGVGDYVRNYLSKGKYY